MPGLGNHHGVGHVMLLLLLHLLLLGNSLLL
jgi:hypothetical protein